MNTAETARTLVAGAAARRAAFLDAERRRTEEERAKDSPAEATARRMAADMLDIAAVKTCVEEDDLLGRGYSLAEIAAHGRRAREIANADSVRTLS